MDDSRLNFEQRIHSLLTGQLPPGETGALLKRLTRDQAARDVLDEMLDVQEQARAAFGYDQDDEAMETSRAAFIKSLQFPAADKTPDLRPERLVAAKPRSADGRPTWPMWLGRAAALLLIVGTAVLAAASYWTSRRVANEMSRGDVAAEAVLDPVTDEELEGFRTIWTQVAMDGTEERPWVLLTDGTGEFGYLPGAPAAENEGLMLVRCLLASPDGNEVQTVNLLLPRRSIDDLSLPAVARVDGKPVTCRISASGHRAGVGVTVGDNHGNAAGIRGTTAIDAAPVEIGQIRLDGRRLRVVVQVVSLNRTTG